MAEPSSSWIPIPWSLYQAMTFKVTANQTSMPQQPPITDADRLARLEALVKQWQEMADFGVEESNLQSAQAFAQCAQELDAALDALFL